MSKAERCVLIGLFAIAACDDGATPSLEGPGGDDAPSGAVVVRTDPASSGECPHGGSVVSSGIDDDHNSKLDDSEIRTRTVLCRDALPQVVVRLLPEPAGAHCAQGGTAVLSGPDRNGNGALDDDEVTSTDYVCGEPLLTRFAAEPQGAHCTAGGVVFFIGRDRNRDSVLDDTEIEQTEYQCGDILTRAVTIQSAEDVAALAGIRVIHGWVAMNATTIEELSLPQLEHVDGILQIAENRDLRRIDLPRLQDVDWFLQIRDNPSLATVDLSRLFLVGTSLEITDNPLLNDLSRFDSLNVGTRFSIVNNASLPSAMFIGRCGGPIEVKDNPALANLFVHATSEHAEVRIVHNGVHVLSLGGDGLGNVLIRDNTALPELFMLASRIDAMTVTGNTSLSRLALSPNSVIGNLTISGNPQLTGVFLERVHVTGSLVLAAPVRFTGSPIRVDGDLTLDGTGFTELVPDQPFSRVGGALRLINNPRLHGIWFQTPGGSVELVNNAQLGGTMFSPWPFGSPMQQFIHGDVIVAHNPMLRMNQFLDLINHIEGSLRVFDNAELLEAATSGIARIDGSIEVHDNPMLEHLGFDLLDTAGGAITITQNPALPLVDFPALFQSSGITVSRNQGLHHLRAAALTRADMTVTDNPVLPACEIVALFSRIGGQHQQSGNDEIATCAPP